ncbi:MAG: DUF3524 domain-containing protein [bacterium]|nr:DUF3524 domain-containing protein [bacterium]
MPVKPWIIIEPYYGGSHRHLVDMLIADSPVEFELWTLPPRKWKWRMRGAALHFAERWRLEMPDAAGILTSSLLDAAALRGLLPLEARGVPLVNYYHENQLRYPVQVNDKRDFHYAWTNIQSAMASDLLLWNSEYNRDSFLEELPRFMRRLPDARIDGLAERIRERSRILPVPLQLQELAARAAAEPPKRGPCRILWNHRWEHDKGPDVLFETLIKLKRRGIRFEVSVLGQSFERVPAIFAEGRAALGDSVHAWGFLPDREDYYRELLRADIALSTARHEFQGLAVLEAVAAGAVPLVPDDLAYREIWPEECRYPVGGLSRVLQRAIRNLEDVRAADHRARALDFDWRNLRSRWHSVFDI